MNPNAIMEIYPIDYVNNPAIIGQNDNVISINNFLQIAHPQFQDNLLASAKKIGFL